MPKTKAQKQEIMTKLSRDLEKQNAIVFVNFKGMKVKEIAELRKQLKQSGSKLIVAKKTLLSKTLEKRGIAADLKHMEGQIAAIFALEDSILPIKTVYAFAKTNQNMKILGGYFEHELQRAEQIIGIAQLPSRQELLAKFVGQLAAPMSGFMNVLQGTMKGLVYVLAAKAKANS